jgi:hypothetical protein
MIKYRNKFFKKNGYITLLSILVVGAVGVAIASTIILLGLSSSNSSFSYQQMHQAKGLASACAEEALQKIREATSFTGAGNLSAGQGTCTYNVVNTGGEARTINAVGTVGVVVRKINISISNISPLIVVNSWQEL